MSTIASPMTLPALAVAINIMRRLLGGSNFDVTIVS